MENINVKVEANAQEPEVAVETTDKVTSQIPRFFQKWNDLVKKDLWKAKELATDSFQMHTTAVNEAIFEYLRKGSTLALYANGSQFSLHQILAGKNSDTNARRTAVICSHEHPRKELDSLSPEGRREYFRVYLELLTQEYGAIKYSNYFQLRPQDYLEDVVPNFKTEHPSKDPKPSESPEPAQQIEAPKPAEPPKPAAVVDDIELLFSRRDQHL